MMIKILEEIEVATWDICTFGAWPPKTWLQQGACASLLLSLVIIYDMSFLKSVGKKKKINTVSLPFPAQ